MYDGLRERAFRTTPKDVGVEKDASEAIPYGILMETGYPQAVATLSVFASGDTSLYFSTGGGVIGGIGHETVRKAAVHFIEQSRMFLSSMAQCSDTPLPPQGEVRFYILTTKGLFTTRANEIELGEGRSPLSPLFYSGQEVITQLRMATEKQKSQEQGHP
jgi:hypothetical protein